MLNLGRWKGLEDTRALHASSRHEHIQASFAELHLDFDLGVSTYKGVMRTSKYNSPIFETPCISNILIFDLNFIPISVFLSPYAGWLSLDFPLVPQI